jgi:cytochrome c
MVMSLKARTCILLGVVSGAIALSFSASAFAADAVDAAAAKSLARKNSCLRCHSTTKKKEGPTYGEIAYKYKGVPDAQQKLIGHITLGQDRVKLTDGHTEDHHVIKSATPEQVKNLINWILAQ